MSQTIDTAFRRIDTESRQGTFGAPGSWGPTDTYKASRAYDKLIGLTIVALIAGVAGWAVVPTGLAFGALVVAFVVVLISWFRMQWARVLAPIYAVCEGLGLGAVSGIYSKVESGIVPLAIVFTGGVFVACLLAYRSGLVRVTPRLAMMAGVGAVGLIGCAVLSLFIAIPGLSTFGGNPVIVLIVGVLCLFVAVLNLFRDFDYVQRAEAMGLPAKAEWASALAMMTALVLVYISMLRILSVLFGGRRQ